MTGKSVFGSNRISFKSVENDRKRILIQDFDHHIGDTKYIGYIKVTLLFIPINNV